MKKRSTKEKDLAPSRRLIDKIKEEIVAMEIVCSGTQMARKKACGKSNCRCATDPDALHGPYHEWNRWENGRLVHKIVSAEQAAELKKAIANRRRIQTLLRDWERAAAEIILSTKKKKG